MYGRGRGGKIDMGEQAHQHQRPKKTKTRPSSKRESKPTPPFRSSPDYIKIASSSSRYTQTNPLRGIFISDSQLRGPPGAGGGLGLEKRIQWAWGGICKQRGLNFWGFFSPSLGPVSFLYSNKTTSLQKPPSHPSSPKKRERSK